MRMISDQDTIGDGLRKFSYELCFEESPQFAKGGC